MKKSILTYAALVFMAVSILSGCKTPADKVEDAKESVTEAHEDVTEADQELTKANADYLADIETYKVKTSQRITENEKTISDFKERIKNEKENARDDYYKKLAVLEKKNMDMGMRMDNYKADTKENWDTFKTDFIADMDKLNQSLKDLFSKKHKV